MSWNRTCRRMAPTCLLSSTSSSPILSSSPSYNFRMETTSIRRRHNHRTILCPKTTTVVGKHFFWYSSSSSINNGNSDGNSTSGTEQHAYFQEQLQELERERKNLFGDENDGDGNDGNLKDPLGRYQSTDHPPFYEQHTPFTQQYSSSTLDSSNDNDESHENEHERNDYTPSQELTKDELDWMHWDREALFGFSEEEKSAWTNSVTSNNTKMSPEYLQQIIRAREEQQRREEMETEKEQPVGHRTMQGEYDSTSNFYDSSSDDVHHEAFSHVSQDGTSVHMVDVGSKAVTTRTATAQSKIWLPREVLEAFDILPTTTNDDKTKGDNTSELIGPKGPIFATAKLAGIMAAKKTSDLIPLCHPLPLDQVKIDIHLNESTQEVIVNCTCRVTHKTGVEMEALTGCTVAALTIYDMVKAVTHNVQIIDTRLISKSGGKRKFVDNNTATSTTTSATTK